MKTRNVVFSLILVAGIALSLIQGQAWGWGGVENPYGVDPRAAGIRYSGPLTVYLECVPVLDKKGNVINPCRAKVIQIRREALCSRRIYRDSATVAMMNQNSRGNQVIRSWACVLAVIIPIGRIQINF